MVISPQLTSVPAEIVARVLVAGCGTPLAAQTCSLVCCNFSQILAANKEQVWCSALAELQWPPSREVGREGIVKALEQKGYHCRRLVVSLFRSRQGDLMLLSKLCPDLTSLRLNGVNRTLDLEVWKVWGKTLRELRLGFWYDGQEGEPATREILQGVGTYCGQELRYLEINGVDSPKMKARCLSVFEEGIVFPHLELLRLKGEQDFSEAELATLQQDRPRLTIETSTHEVRGTC